MKKGFRFIFVAGAILCASQAHAIFPVSGWGYSLGYAADRALGVITAEDDLWSFWIDPSAASIEKGRVTLLYDPTIFTVKDYGWLGGFGANPALPAPPVTTDGVIPTLAPDGQPWKLQAAASGLASSVNVNPTEGRITIDFDWGTTPYQPTNDDHFNIFGVTMAVPKDTTGFEFVPRGTGDFGLAGSAADVSANGDNASTYMKCNGGYCGEEPKGDLRRNIPEPSTLMLISSSLLGYAGYRVRRRKGQ
jgi:hypothetical protein